MAFDDLGSVHKYQSLVAWKRAHAVAILTLRATDAAYHPRHRPLFDQIRRAVISIEANIVEGYALSTPLQFRKHLRIALGSAAEVECLVRMALELRYLPEKVAREIEGAAGDAMRPILGLLKTPIRAVT